MKFKEKNSLIYGLSVNFCFFIKIRKIIRNNDAKFYYYYDLKMLANFLKIDLKKT